MPEVSWPSRDPATARPGMVFYQGKWRSPESVERRRVWKRDYESVGAEGWGNVDGATSPHSVSACWLI